MKNYQKNSRNPSVPFSCMLEQLIGAVQHKSIKWHLNNHIWSLNLNLVFKPTSFNLLLVALAQNTFILPCHDHASYCALHWLCSLLCCRYLSPLDRRDTDDVIVDTDEDSMLSSEVPGKQNPLVHSDTIPLSRSCSLLLHQDNNDSSVTCCGS